MIMLCLFALLIAALLMASSAQLLHQHNPHQPARLGAYPSFGSGTVRRAGCESYQPDELFGLWQTYGVPWVRTQAKMRPAGEC